MYKTLTLIFRGKLSIAAKKLALGIITVLILELYAARILSFTPPT